MIKLVVEEYCHNCAAFEPEANIATYYDDKEMQYTNTNVECVNAKKCRNMYRHIKREVNKGEC